MIARRNAASQPVFALVMRTFSILSLAVVLATSSGCAVRAQDYPPGGGYGYDGGGYADDGDYDERPGYDPSIDAGNYEQPLSPYGEWVVDRTYGRIWRPTTVYAGWSPYTDGEWGWTRWGWTFVAPVPWGWTFHYGRWIESPVYGWSWYPGTVWGPAWVDWYAGDGYVGWAPLAPFGVVSVNHYVFVDERRFCSPGLRGYIRHDRDVPDVVRRNVWDRRIVRPPDHDHIVRVARDPVRQFDRPGAGGFGPRNGGPRGDDRRIVRPGDAGGRDQNFPRRIERGDRGDDNRPGRYAQPGRPSGDDDRSVPRRIERPDADAGGRPRFDRQGDPGDDGRTFRRRGGPDGVGDAPRQVYRPPSDAAPMPRRFERGPEAPRGYNRPQAIERDDRRVIERATPYRGAGGGPPVGYRRAEPMPGNGGGGFGAGGPRPGPGPGAGPGPGQGGGGNGGGGEHHGHRVISR